MSKIINFVKENKVFTFALVVLALSLGLLAIPGFARTNFMAGEFKTKLSGYQTFFNTETTVGLDVKILKGVCGAGIAAFVMIIVSMVGIVFSKKSSFVAFLTGLALLTISILFFSMEASVNKIVPIVYKDHASCGFVTYLIAALILIASGLVIYKSVLMMKDEIKHPAKSKGTTYNYLKK